MQAYQRKVLQFLVKLCYEEYLTWGNDEIMIEELTFEDRETLTRDCLHSQDSEDNGPYDVFSITSLCHLAEAWLKEGEKDAD